MLATQLNLPLTIRRSNQTPETIVELFPTPPAKQNPNPPTSELRELAELVLTDAEMRRHPDWQKEALCSALCKGSKNFEFWFQPDFSFRNDDNVPYQFINRVREAFGEVLSPYQICERCPVRAQCLTTSIQLNAIGIWGGTSYNARRKIRRLLRKQDQEAIAV